MGMPTACRLCGRALAPHAGDAVGRHAHCERCTAKAAGGKAAGEPPDECRECGKKFHARASYVKYCSDACSAASRRRINAASQRKYMADPENRAKSLARSRERSAALTARAQGEGGRRRPRAARGRGTAARGQRSARMSEPSACRLCGRTFLQYGDHWTNYCKRCRARIDKKINAVLSVRCAVCGKRFATKSPLAKYCSPPCRKAARRQGKRAASRRRRPTPKRTPE